MYIAIGLYMAIVLIASFHFNYPLTPERIAFLLLIAALGTGKVRLFLKDWSIFLVVLLAWQLLSGLSHDVVGLKPHVDEMITVDKWLFFGNVPTVWLQHHFYRAGDLEWYDVAATCLYLMHFALPMGVAFALWVWKRAIFVEFTLTFLVVALAGFATFVLFPAAPPWVAANWLHHLPHVTRIYNVGITFFGGTTSFSAFQEWLWRHGGWDVYGAMPSEHAAFPFLCFLYARRAWERAGWALLPYCLAVWVAVVYLGEHYVTDVIAGILYATLAYLLVQFALSRRGSQESESQTETPTSGSVTDTSPA